MTGAANGVQEANADQASWLGRTADQAWHVWSCIRWGSLPPLKLCVCINNLQHESNHGGHKTVWMACYRPPGKSNQTCCMPAHLGCCSAKVCATVTAVANCCLQHLQSSRQCQQCTIRGCPLLQCLVCKLQGSLLEERGRGWRRVMRGVQETAACQAPQKHLKTTPVVTPGQRGLQQVPRRVLAAGCAARTPAGRPAVAGGAGAPLVPRADVPPARQSAWLRWQQRHHHLALQHTGAGRVEGQVAQGPQRSNPLAGRPGCMRSPR